MLIEEFFWPEVEARAGAEAKEAIDLFAYLDDWYSWIKPQYLLQTIAVITAATRSVNLAIQSIKT